MPSSGLTPAQLTDAIASANDAAVEKYEKNGGFYCFDIDAPRSFPLIRAMQTEPITIKGGEYITWRFNYRDDGDPAFVLPGQTYSPVHKQIIKKLTVPWAHAHTMFTVLDEDVAANREPEQIIDFVALKRKSTGVGHGTLVENKAWAAHPTSSDTDPYTIPSWIVPITTAQVAAATSGFQGGMPSGASTLAGLDITSATYNRFWNYNFVWSNSGGTWTNADAANAGKMFDELDFETPPMAGDFMKPPYNKRRIYVDHTMLESMQQRAREQNDQVGADLAAYQGTVLFRGLRPEWQKQLDTADATARGAHPFYLVDWSAIRPVVREGEYFRHQVCAPSAQQPDCVTTHVWLVYNLIALSRQRLGVGSYVA